ncbi:unannotated protein [freshwater metagenome]|uniref:Unannotated protein n=1 Tax=freshwater metagenome TaxID=449393 RepID=A0A6J7IS41_9ZZZZ|nr:hypothetical protein [Actinomycetota bacterium]
MRTIVNFIRACVVGAAAVSIFATGGCSSQSTGLQPSPSFISTSPAESRVQPPTGLREEPWPVFPSWADSRAQELAVAASMQDPASDGWPKSTTHVEIGLISGDEFDEARGASGAHATTSEMLVVILKGEFRSPRGAPGGANPSDGPVLEYAWFGLDPVSGEAMGSYMGHEPLKLPIGAAVQVLLNR